MTSDMAYLQRWQGEIRSYLGIIDGSEFNRYLGIFMKNDTILEKVI